MSDVLDDKLSLAEEALAQHAWSEALALLQDADRAGELSTDALESLAEAAWWSGDLASCIDARERAYAAYIEQGNRRRAAVVASKLAKDHFAKLASSVGTAWLSRAEHLLADEPECIEHGVVARMLGVVAFEAVGDNEAALGHAKRTAEIGRRCGSRDLEALGRHDQGRVLVAMGHVSEGIALIDEANVAAVAGELSPMTTGIVYCNTIAACELIADYRRAAEWTDAAKRWCERQSIAGFPGICRVHRASVIRLRGAWAEAEREARLACDELKDFNLGAAGEAFNEIGEIRLRLGDLRGANEAFRQAHELGCSPQPGLSLLRLAEGKVEGAVTCIRRALEGETQEFRRVRLLPAAVEIALAADEHDWAREAAAELEVAAGTYGTSASKATAACARGAVELAEGEAASAVRSLHRGWQLWHELDAPFEAAKARLLLGEAYRATGDVETGMLELQAALGAFERLGATIAAQDAAELVGDGGATVAIREASMTFMFTDIVRSTPLVEAIGDDAWANLLRWHDETLRALFTQFGGTESSHTGDGFFVSFADAASAFDCAVRIQRTLADHRRAHGFAPQVRIGIHSAQAARSASSYRGKGVHAAARIAELAGADEILASRASPPPGARLSLSQPRTETLRGVSEPLELVSVDWRL